MKFTNPHMENPHPWQRNVLQSGESPLSPLGRPLFTSPDDPKETEAGRLDEAQSVRSVQPTDIGEGGADART